MDMLPSKSINNELVRSLPISIEVIFSPRYANLILSPGLILERSFFSSNLKILYAVFKGTLKSSKMIDKFSPSITS